MGITAESSDTGIVIVQLSSGSTNNYGQTTATITCASVPAVPQVVTVTIKGNVGGEDREEIIQINVG